MLGVQLRRVDDIVVALMIGDTDLAEGLELWYEALAREGVRATLVLAVGAIRSEAKQRRRTVEALHGSKVEVVVVTDDRFNRGLVRTFGYLGVPITAFEWTKLSEAARTLAPKPAVARQLCQAARDLRTSLDRNFGSV